MEIKTYCINPPETKPDHTRHPESLLVKIAEMERSFRLKERAHEAETAKLKHDIRELERDNAALLDLLAQVMLDNNPTLVIREENFGHPHEFRFDRNIAGEPLLVVIR